MRIYDEVLGDPRGSGFGRKGAVSEEDEEMADGVINHLRTGKQRRGVKV
jgi:hypothetical protein